ncbi:MAG TPA: PhzF family phenazine biosynthesis protein [Solimonas sp.]
MERPHDLRFHTLDVFTERLFGGNPLAVVFGGERLNTAQMQTIAREFNLSETVFVLSPTRPDCLHRLRIFTPTQEMPFAGHPTVGTACLLSELRLVPGGAEAAFSLEENIGAVPVCVRRAEGRATYAELTAARPPAYGAPPPDNARLAAALGLTAADLGRGAEQPRIASCGVPFLLVPLRAPELLAGVEPEASTLRELLQGVGAQELYVYAHGYEPNELRARMFAPALGIPEDPATGAAAVALAGALGMEAQQDGTHEWLIHQGVEMGRPSQLHIAVDRSGGVVTAVRVGGYAVTVSEGILRSA